MNVILERVFCGYVSELVARDTAVTGHPQKCNSATTHSVVLVENITNHWIVESSGGKSL